MSPAPADTTPSPHQGKDGIGVVLDQSPGALLWAAGLTWDELPRLCQVSARTVQRWRARRALPAVVVLFLACFQDLGIIAPAWSGWQLSARKGELFSPEGVGFRPGDVQSLHWRLQQIGALRRRVAELEERAAELGRELEQRPPLSPQRWRPARARRSPPRAKTSRGSV